MHFNCRLTTNWNCRKSNYALKSRYCISISPIIYRFNASFNMLYRTMTVWLFDLILKSQLKYLKPVLVMWKLSDGKINTWTIFTLFRCIFIDLWLFFVGIYSAGAGVDNIDINAATKHDVIVLKWVKWKLIISIDYIN